LPPVFIFALGKSHRELLSVLPLISSHSMHRSLGQSCSSEGHGAPPLGARCVANAGRSAVSCPFPDELL
jgi:hypothetical protein